MNHKVYDNQKITAYLLGALPEEDTERFDELSFIDDEFADALKTAENDLVDAYINGELRGAELANFESFYLSSPLRREKVEFAGAFQTFAEKKIAETNNEISIAKNPESTQTIAGFFSSFNIFKTLKPAWKLSFAALGLIIIAFGGWLLIGLLNQQTREMQAKKDVTSPREQELQTEAKPPSNIEPEKEIARTGENIEPLPTKKEKTPAVSEAQKTPAQPKPIAPKPVVASFVLAPPLRGNNQLQNLSVPANASAVKMRLQLEANDFDAYKVELINHSNNKTLWRSGAIKTKKSGENNALDVRFPANLLKPAIYSLIVSGVGGDGEPEIISNYPFRVVIK